MKSMCPHSAVQCHARRLRSVCMHVVLCGTHGDTVKLEGLLTGTLLSNIGEGHHLHRWHADGEVGCYGQIQDALCRTAKPAIDQDVPLRPVAIARSAKDPNHAIHLSRM